MRLQNAIDASLALVQLYPSSHQRPPPKNLKKPAVRASCKAIIGREQRRWVSLL